MKDFVSHKQRVIHEHDYDKYDRWVAISLFYTISICTVILTISMIKF